MVRLCVALIGFALCVQVSLLECLAQEASDSPPALLTPGMQTLLGGFTEGPRLGSFPTPGPMVPVQSKVEILEAFEALDDPPLNYDILQYASEVKAKLGVFQSFSVFQAGSKIIPITLNGVVVPSGSHVPGGTCDRPPWLGLGAEGQAVPYSRVGRLKALKEDGTDNPDVDWCFIARRYKIRTDENYEKFEDVAVVGHNRVTGFAAFFQMLSPAAPKDARDVPSPMASDAPTQTSAKAFWLTPQQTAGIGCYRCHDADPWVHSPYIDQVSLTMPSGQVVPMVPRGADLATIPSVNPPYSFVGSQAFSDWPTPKQFKPAENLCVKCHRIGSHFSDQFIAYSVGLASPPGQSALFSMYPHSHTMPPQAANGMTRAAFDAIFLDSARQLRSLISNQNDAGAEQPIAIP